MANSAKRDANGTWHIQYRYTDWTGKKRKSSKKGFKTKKEAEDWLAHFLLQQASDPSMTLKDFWEIYMEDMKKRLKETTVANKEQIFQNCILPYFGDWLDILCIGTEDEAKEFFLTDGKEVSRIVANIRRTGDDILGRNRKCVG